VAGFGMTAQDRDVRAPEGRTIRVREDGDLRGVPVFILHGQPGSRVMYRRHVEDAQRKGIRLIGYDRPGYGGSTRVLDRAVGDVAKDVEIVADALGLDRFGLWGISAGGAPALACAARLGRRAAAVASLAGVAPYPADGLDWTAGMGEYNVVDFRLMLSDRPAWEAKNEKELVELQDATPAQLVESLASLLSEVDRAACTAEFAQFLYENMHEAFRPGIGGSVDDCLSGVRPWGFELPDIRGPVLYWHGEQDRFVPVSHGRWIAARLPSHADVRITPEDGHLTLYANRIPAVHDWLLGQYGR
jgi:pimeloyl-ACP methyl ester carboxylesterase